MLQCVIKKIFCYYFKTYEPPPFRIYSFVFVRTVFLGLYKNIFVYDNNDTSVHTVSFVSSFVPWAKARNRTEMFTFSRMILTLVLFTISIPTRVHSLLFKTTKPLPGDVHKIYTATIQDTHTSEFFVYREGWILFFFYYPKYLQFIMFTRVGT